MLRRKISPKPTHSIGNFEAEVRRLIDAGELGSSQGDPADDARGGVESQKRPKLLVPARGRRR